MQSYIYYSTLIFLYINIVLLLYIVLNRFIIADILKSMFCELLKFLLNFTNVYLLFLH